MTSPAPAYNYDDDSAFEDDETDVESVDEEYDDEEATDSDQDVEEEDDDEEEYDNEQYEEDSESEEDDDRPSLRTVYSRSDLLGTASSAERRYIKARPGICAGMSLAWLQLIECNGVSPRDSWPSVNHSRILQEHIESNYIRYTRFPEIGYMHNGGMRRFKTVDAGLNYVWQNPGSYMLLIRPRREFIGHAVAYSDSQSYPHGYLMNPNNGNHCCYTYAGLAQCFRSDPFVLRSEYNRYGADFIIAKIGSDFVEQEDAVDEFEEIDITVNAGPEFPYIQFHGTIPHR